MSGFSHDQTTMDALSQRVHDGAFMTHLEAEKGISATTIRKYYRRWCKERGIEERKSNFNNLPKITGVDHIIKDIILPEKHIINDIIPPPTYPQKPEIIGKRIAVIPDMQVKPGIDLSYCSRIGKYIAYKKPDIIINGGDFADMPSLNTYDLPGSRGMEGQRYKEDILSVQTAMRLFMAPIKEEMGKTGWKPRLVLTLGNHEDRIDRAIKTTPKLDGVIGLSDLHYEEWGWEVYRFLEPVVVEGIAFCHYFCSGIMGRPITTARALLGKLHMSSFAFHQQGRDIAFGKRADGRQMIAVIAGSCYEHSENYLNHQTNNHWRGLYFLNDVVDGEYEENAVSLKYLRRKYE